MDIRNITEIDSFQENLKDEPYNSKEVYVGNVIVSIIVNETLNVGTGGGQSGTSISIGLNPQSIEPTKLGFFIITPNLTVDNIEKTEWGRYEYYMTDKGTYRLTIVTDQKEYKFIYENSYVAEL